MSIKVRLALLLGTLLVAFLVVLQVLRLAERARMKELVTETRQSNLVAVQRWADLLAQPARRLGRDYAAWPGLAGFIDRPDAAWAENNLHQALANYETHALWVLDPQGRLVYSAQNTSGPALPVPVEAAGLGPPTLEGDGRHFFAESRDGLLEIWANVVTGEDSHAHGWLLVAKLWGARFVSTLSRLTETRIQLAPLLQPDDATAPDLLLIPLRGLTGAVVRQLQVRFPAADYAGIFVHDTLAANLFIGFGLFLITALWLAVRRWVLNPLDRIGESLAREDSALIQPLRQGKTELGRVADLVESSFVQKAALKREIEERSRAESALRESELLVRRSLELRARLARDLHDGVIQSIYAAGLGLESALSQIHHDESAARLPLQQCRQSLNDIIREVRGFITGLEPEQMPRQAFAQELESLARTMQALWPVRVLLDLDPALARRLNPTQEVHALQIVRECISNALRHGEAKEVRITLAAGAGGTGVLRVQDNGQGFVPAERQGQGSGLVNFGIRAREMGGTARIESERGRGAAVSITFPLDVRPLI